MNCLNGEEKDGQLSTSQLLTYEFMSFFITLNIKFALFRSLKIMLVVNPYEASEVKVCSGEDEVESGNFWVRGETCCAALIT